MGANSWRSHRREDLINNIIERKRNKLIQMKRLTLIDPLTQKTVLYFTFTPPPPYFYYNIQFAVRGCTSKRDRKKNECIHRFPKRENAGQQWIEACANPYLPSLEYLQVVERQFFVFHRHFDKQCFNQKRNGAFLLKYGAIPTLNLPPGSDMSCHSNVNMKPAAVSSPSEFEMLMPEIEKTAEGIRDFGESSVQFTHVSSHIFNFKRCC